MKKKKSWQDNVPWAVQNDVYAAEREKQRKNQDGREGDPGVTEIFSVEIGKQLKSLWDRLRGKR